MKYYPQFTRSYVEDELPLDEGWAFLAGALTQDGWLQFSGVRMVTDGYVKQAAKRILSHGQ